MRLAVAALCFALITGVAGAATIDGTRKADRIVAQYNGARDTVRCGQGRDIVTADRLDRIAADCEVVSRLVSRDPYRTRGAQHETQVEPDALAVGGTVVATFQTGRRHDGGATDIGFATSTDGGRTWRGGHLPGQTVSSMPAGAAQLASDPVVAYDALHGTWLISTLAVAGDVSELYISRSANGRSWSRPVVAARAEGSELAYDKNWATCDMWPQSPFFGRCYLAYTDHIGGRPKLAVQTSDDAGLTWSEPVIALRSSQTVGVMPVVRPDGALVIPYLGPDEIQSVRSTDGGASFEPEVTIAAFDSRGVPALRAFPLPTAAVDAAGRLYVAWQDCRFRARCAANDIVLSTSTDGVAWGTPARVTRGTGTAFLPDVAVEGNRVVLLFHRCVGSPCRLDAFLKTSRDGGASWAPAQRLTAQSMRAGWLPATSSGRMLADYVAAVFVRGRPLAVYSLATSPRGGRFRQAIAAALLR